MGTYEPMAGDTIDHAAREMVRLASATGEIVEAKFNDQKITASPGSDPARIASDYERGKAEREYEGQLLAIARQQRDDAKADRDRLAKRCEEVEADVAGADEFLRSTAWENPAGAATIAARVRLAYEAGVTDGAHNEAMVERANASRLADIRARGEVPR